MGRFLFTSKPADLFCWLICVFAKRLCKSRQTFDAMNMMVVLSEAASALAVGGGRNRTAVQD